MNDAQKFVNSVLMSSKTSQPRSIIIGTDWWTDCDDVLAMKLFCWAHKQRLIKIEGVAINACMEHSVEVLRIRKEYIGDNPAFQGRFLAYVFSSPFAHGGDWNYSAMNGTYNLEGSLSPKKDFHFEKYPVPS